MIDYELEMEQYDCPFIDTSSDHDVAFSTFQWEFDESARELETRMVVDGDDRGHLAGGLTALRNHRNMHDFALLKRWDHTAHIRTVIDETDAMEIIRQNDGYITGPFYIEAGEEVWHIGFDSAERADVTLSDLEKNNEFDVVSRHEQSHPDLQSLVRNAHSALRLIDGCRDLSDVERETLEAAVEGGYFESPRQATLGTLAEEFDVSKPAISKNLRRGEQKIISSVVAAMEDLEES
ncbi:MAG: helix-turn-helix domain-containing protein [Haloarculaceae archaeon]